MSIKDSCSKSTKTKSALYPSLICPTFSKPKRLAGAADIQFTSCDNVQRFCLCTNSVYNKANALSSETMPNGALSIGRFFSS